MPGDVQYIDARWEVPVVLPLLDCLAQELNMLCCVDGSVNFVMFSTLLLLNLLAVVASLICSLRLNLIDDGSRFLAGQSKDSGTDQKVQFWHQ